MTVMNMKILAIQNNNGYTENLPHPLQPLARHEGACES